MNLEDLELNDAIMTRLFFNDFQDISDKKLCERWKKKYLKRNKLKKGEYIMLKDKY